MEFARPRPRRRAEPVLAMINVVFLLLIFFLITARIAPAPPIDVAPPAVGAAADAAGGEDVLFVGADGRLAYGAARGEAVFAVLAEGAGAPLALRADGALPAAEVARLVARLAAIGRGEVRLEVVAR